MGTGLLLPGFLFVMDRHFAGCHGELHLGDFPRSLNSQDLLIEFFVSHAPYSNQPTRSGEEPFFLGRFLLGRRFLLGSCKVGEQETNEQGPA